MLYLLQDKYYSEGVYPSYIPICGFTSSQKAKEIEYMLGEYLTKNTIFTPNDYFDILTLNESNIVLKLTKILGNETAAKTLVQYFVNKEIYEYPKDWKSDGLWFKTKEIKEF